MKPASDAPDSGQIVETTTRRRIVPVDPLDNAKKPDFWEYLLAIDEKKEWERHVIYIYRDQPAPRFQATKCGRMLRFADSSEIPIFDQQEVEGNIQRRCGGGRFQFIVKRGPSINANLWLEIGAPPRSPAEVLAAFDRQSSPIGATVTPISISGNGSADSAVAIASKAMDTVAGQDRDAINIGINALANAAKIMQDFTTRAPAPASPADDVLRQALAVMLQKALNPPDPLELLSKVLALQAQLNPNNGANPLMTQIMETGLKRLLEPVPSGNGPVSAGAELVRSLPSVAGYVVDGLREWRIGMEAQRDGVAIMRAPGPPTAPGAPVAAPAQVLPPPAHNPAVPTPPAQAQGAQNVGAPSLEFIETRIVELLRAAGSAEEAADRTLEFLYTLEGENPKPEQQLVTQLVALGETGLLQLFQRRPILKQATANTPRLLDFIRAFLKLYAEEKAEEEKEANERKPN